MQYPNNNKLNNIHEIKFEYPIQYSFGYNKNYKNNVQILKKKTIPSSVRLKNN